MCLISECECVSTTAKAVSPVPSNLLLFALGKLKPSIAAAPLIFCARVAQQKGFRRLFSRGGKLNARPTFHASIAEYGKLDALNSQLNTS